MAGKPIKERESVIDTNYARFYEFDCRKSEFCTECVANRGEGNWNIVPRHMLASPVHTNWPSQNQSIELIYICESPSNRETSYSLPSVGKTGMSIYREEFGKIRTGWLDELDNNIYRTNIVRCQADSGLQKRVNSTIKNRRVKEAFQYCLNHLNRELICIFQGISQINQKKEIKIVLAIGRGFPKQTRQIEKFIVDHKSNYKNLTIEVWNRAHPSA